MPCSTTLSRNSHVWFVVLALVAILPIDAWGQGATNPTFTRIQQGSLFDGVVVSCDTSHTDLLNCDAGAIAASGDWRSVTCVNDGTNKVHLCPGECSACVAATKGYVVLAAGSSFTFGASAKGLKLGCIATGGASTVRCYAER